MKLVFVYRLVDPRDESTKYVDSSSNPFTRLKAHWKNATTPLCDCDVCEWIRELSLDGLRPRMEVVKIGRMEDQEKLERECREKIECELLVGRRTRNIKDFGKEWTDWEVWEMLEKVKDWEPRSRRQWTELDRRELLERYSSAKIRKKVGRKLDLKSRNKEERCNNKFSVADELRMEMLDDLDSRDPSKRITSEDFPETPSSEELDFPDPPTTR